MTSVSETLAERAAATLQQAILNGELSPGGKLSLPLLVERFGIGVTPLREGLSRLVAQGLVEAIGQRGFRVVSTSEEDLLDLTEMRILIETEALRRSIRRGDDAWEARIIAALYRLRKAAKGAAAGEPPVDFNALHKEFHCALVGACGSRRLIEMHSQLYDQAYRYRRVLMKTGDFTPDLSIDEHEEIGSFVLERRGEEACALLALHLKNTLRHTYPDAYAEGVLLVPPKRKRETKARSA